MMREIYRRSEETFVCLSNPQVNDCLSWAYNYGSTLASSPIISGENPLVTRLKGFLRSELKNLNSQDSRLFGWLRSLMAFLGSPVWKRAWIYQELIVSPRPRLISGFDAFLWMELPPLLDFVCSGLEEYLASQFLKIRARHEAEIQRSHKLHTVYRQHLVTYRNGYIQRLATIKERLPVALDSSNQKLRDLAEYLNKEIPRAYHQRINLQYGMFSRIRQNKEKLDHLSHEISCLIDSEMRLKRLQADAESFGRNLLRRVNIDINSTATDPLIDRKTLKSVYSQLEETLGKINDLLSICRAPAELNNQAVTNVLKRLKEWDDHELEYPHPQKPPTNPKTLESNWRSFQNSFESFRSQVRRLEWNSVLSLAKKRAARRSADLKVHLQHSRNCAASDPRDRIYAFLGLADKRYKIIPVYTFENTIVHVLIDAAVRIIQHEKTLKILEHVGRGRDQLCCYLPTWVPDWTSRELDIGLERFAWLNNRGQKPRDFYASRDLQAQVEFREDPANASNVDICTKGTRIEILDALEDIIPQFESLQEFSSLEGLRIITSKSVLEDDEVWILRGASKPVVLRPEGEKYSFLSEALVFEDDGDLSDVMFGSVIDKLDQGQVEWQDIWIM